jgi:parvulin-like peptidyl-prolyl isomerase
VVLMLDQMRKHSRSFIIYIFFGIIIAVFVINFGPQSQGCVAKTSYAGQINGEPLTVGQLNYAFAVAGFSGRGMSAAQLDRLRAYALDRLVVRELMAERAREMGLMISEDKIRQMLLDGRYLALGMDRRLVASDEETLDYERFSKFVRFNWRITVRQFKEQQRRELLAKQLLEVLHMATQVSSEEARRDFIQRNTRADLYYVRFDPKAPERKLEPTAEQIAAFAAKESKQIEQYFETSKVSYTNRPEELKLAVIAIAHDKAGGAESALEQATKLREQISSKRASFAELARKHSTRDSATRGGEIGWANATRAGFGKTATEALAKLQEGELSAVVQGEKEALLFRLDGRRKGDLTLDQVRDEIAKKLLTEQLSDDRARTRAEGYIRQLQQGKKLTELFASKDETEQENEASGGEEESEAARRPELLSTGPFERSPEHLIPGIGISEELTQRAFKLKEGEVVERPISVGGVYYLLALKEREDASMDEWKSRKDELTEEFRQRQWTRSRQQLEADLCQLAVAEKRVEIDPRALSPGEPSSEGGQPTAAYKPCSTLKPMGI